MKLNLKKPLVLIDIEATGLNIVDSRIIEISLLKIFPDGKEDLRTYRVNPQIPIPPESTKIHRISDCDVQNMPTFNQIAHSLLDFIGDSDIAGYNIHQFDLPILVEEFLRAEIDFNFQKRNIVDVQVIFYRMEPRTLSAAYQFYCDKKLHNAHSSSADVQATYEILLAQIHRYNNHAIENDGKIVYPIVNEIDKLAQFTTRIKAVDAAGNIVLNENNEMIFNFGKYKGYTLDSVFEKEPQYYDWIQKGKFPLSTKKVVHNAYIQLQLKIKKYIKEK